MGYIQAEKVEFSYDGDEGESVKKVLRGISMEIQRGEFVALLGHNGSGKSTMAKMFNAMLLPSQGKVFIDGLDTVDEQVLYEIRRRVGLVLQNPDNQLVASVVGGRGIRSGKPGGSAGGNPGTGGRGLEGR